MPLTTGQTLTHYEILGPLGAGGMGEVWRARDTRLEREVAIKVLPDELADDDERLRRFEREAKTLASLNHTNLAHVYGIDQVDDTCFIAMELVPGDDLATRLARGPLPIDEALDVCRQIAEGLEAAHEAGIVHRDLKPANVRVTPEGVVKILDFGLAKPLQARSTGSGTTTAQSDSFLVTEEGLVLGTPTYMSPEQARGKRVDRRTDIWAFGCVLYECLTGKRAFGGDSLTDILASIVGEEPDWSCLPGDVEPHVLRLLLRCLEKDPRERLRDVGEARIALARGAPDPLDRSRESPRSRQAPVLAVGLLALIVGAVGAWLLRPEGKGVHPDVSETGPRKTLRLTEPLRGALGNVPMLSPDGQKYVFRQDDGLWLQDLADTEPSRIPGTEGAELLLAWSPDAGSIAFERSGHLETLRLGESRGERRCAWPGRRPFGSCSWGDDDAFLVETGGKSEGVFYLAPGTDEFVRLDWLDPGTLTTPHRFHPSFLPGGDRFLITAPSGGESWVQVASLSARTLKPLLRSGNRAEYVPPGYLAWVDHGRLDVQPFDAETGSLLGSPRELVGDVYSFASTGEAEFAFSSEGTLVYLPMDQPNRIEWLDRQGRVLGPATDPRPYAWASLDRTGRWLAASVITPSDGYRDLWLVDLERGTPQRFTDQPGWESTPAWSPDGQRIAFSADWTGPPNVHLKEVGGGPPRELVPFDNHVQFVGSWSSDGRWVLYMSRGQEKGDLWRVDVETLERRPLLETPADERSPTASPDGRWIAFGSDESGRQEIYVGTYPDLKGVRRVSNEGGSDPSWKGDSSELYYRTEAEAIVSVALRETGGLPDPGPEVVVIQPMEDLLTFDVTPDAERFLVVRRTETQIRPVFHLIVGWEGLLE